MESLSEVNLFFLHKLCEFLEIKHNMKSRDSYDFNGFKAEKEVLDICKQANADVYITGPAGMNYLHEENFLKENIELKVFSYDGYKEYPQLNRKFIHQVSIVDMMFNLGKDAKEYLLTV